MRQVSYISNEKMANVVYSAHHPMKPIRLKMTNTLVQDYYLTTALNMVTGRAATQKQICQYHEPQYVEFLKNWVSPKPSKITKQISFPKKPQLNLKTQKYNVNRNFDCPIFDGLYEYCQLTAGSSLDAADLIITGHAHNVINWGGGFHHARKHQASGFCYVNDIVLCILELLKFYPRVLYVDIDVHHGDGVEEAFYHTHRVMTVSFHEYGDDFFPGTGQLVSVGEGEGKYYSINIPLNKGMTSTYYVYLFKKVIDSVISCYCPDVIVMQSGADSLTGDKIGHFELTIGAYGECLDFLRRFNTPLILLGGGGYTVENVARCWAYETSVLLKMNIDNEIPEKNSFYHCYAGDKYKLHFESQENENCNLPTDLDFIIERVRENIREGVARPSVQFHHLPTHVSRFDFEEEEDVKNIEP